MAHEDHVARASGVEAFDVVAVVPSKTTQKDEARPGLRTIVGTVVGHTASRFERLLQPTDSELVGRYFDPDRYATARRLDGESVLLIDDTWVSGSSAQSAAAALRNAGASRVGCVVIGRWLTPSFGASGAPFATCTSSCPSGSTGRAAQPSSCRSERDPAGGEPEKGAPAGWCIGPVRQP